MRARVSAPIRGTVLDLIAGGIEGARRAIAILKRQVDLAMGQIGCNSPAELTGATIMRIDR